MTDREIMMSVIELYNSHMVKLCDELLKLEKSMGLKEQLNVQRLVKNVRNHFVSALYDRLKDLESFQKYKKCCSRKESMVAFLIDNGADKYMLSQTLCFTSKANVRMAYSRAKRKIQKDEGNNRLQRKCRSGVTAVILVLILTVLLASCENRRQRNEVAGLVSQWMGREIVLPDSLPLSRYASGAVSMAPQPSTEYTVLTYSDTSSCFSCQIKLQQWKELVAEVDSSHQGKVTFLFVYNPGRSKSSVREFSRKLRIDEFSHPVWLDTLGIFASLNPVPQRSDFHTFLLNKNLRVVSVGNPVLNPKVYDLYKQMISGEKPSSEVFTTLSHETTIDVGTLKMGTSQTFKVSVKNTGNSIFSLHGLSTSCDCTRATASWKTLSPGKNGDIKIDVTPDAVGDFTREVYIDGNLEGTECITIFGKVI